jgi:hypothetical protein
MLFACVTIVGWQQFEKSVPITSQVVKPLQTAHFRRVRTCAQPAHLWPGGLLKFGSGRKLVTSYVPGNSLVCWSLFGFEKNLLKYSRQSSRLGRREYVWEPHIGPWALHSRTMQPEDARHDAAAVD